MAQAGNRFQYIDDESECEQDEKTPDDEAHG
jgi:hypothetical protein